MIKFKYLDGIIISSSKKELKKYLMNKVIERL